MSSPLAIAAVTAVLKDLLNDGLINHDLSANVGSFSVSALPPDRIETGSQEPNQLNLFLYAATPNVGWRNADLPSRDSNGSRRLSNPPLALDLHYLLTAYGQTDLHAEILLGYGMHLFHKMPTLSRQAIRKTLSNTSPVTAALLPSSFRELTAIDLADQVEQIKLTPQALSIEEISKLWTAFQAPYRPSAAYLASVVLIQTTEPTAAPLPVRQPVISAIPFQGPINTTDTVAVVPHITTPAPLTAIRGGTLVLAITPPVAADQRVALLLGDQAFPLAARPVTDPPATSLTFPIAANAPTGTMLLRVQVDDVQSPLEVDADPKSQSYHQYIGPQVTIT